VRAIARDSIEIGAGERTPSRTSTSIRHGGR
jgi:hypothetical protein